MPKVSIFLSSFNHAGFVREAIESTLNQTYTDFELIIWDDCSNDNSWDLICEYKDPRIKAYRNQQNVGGVFGINKTISEVASGEYIAIHHSDDVWALNKLERQVKYLDDNAEIGAVFTWVQLINEFGENISEDWFNRENITRWAWLNELFQEQNHLCHPSVLIRRSCYQEVGLYSPLLVQITDAEMWSRVLMKYRNFVIPERLTKHRRYTNESNASGQRLDVQIRSSNEWNTLRKNFLGISDFENIVAIFPGLEKYRNPRGLEIKFLLAMACLYEFQCRSAWQLGVFWLYELMNDAEKRECINELYSFNNFEFFKITGQFDPYGISKISLLNNTIDGLNILLIERETQIADLEHTVGLIDEKLNESTQLLEVLSLSVNERDIRIDELLSSTSWRVIERETQIADLEHTVGLIDEKLNESTQLLEVLSLSVNERDIRIDELLSSTSWRVTKGLRWISRIGRRAVRIFKSMTLGKIGRILLHKLPLSMSQKNAIKDVAFSNYGWLFKRMPSYRQWSEIRELARKPLTILSPALQRLELPRELKKILVIDALTPTPDKDAGSVTAWFFLKAFIDLNYDVTFIPDNLKPSGQYTDNLRKLGVRCLTNIEINSIEEFLAKFGPSLDVVLLYRVHTAKFYLPLVKKYAPQAKVIFDTVDLHYLREERQAEQSQDHAALRASQFTKQAEFEVMRSTDVTIVLSQAEQEIVSNEDSRINVRTIPLLLDIHGRTNTFSERGDIVFIGGFLHLPNVDAIKYFVNEIWPIVSSRLPDVNLLIIGSHAPEDISAFGVVDQRIKIIGYVENIDTYFNNCRLSIAPLRYGAGIKGKIGTSSSYGVPCVATSLAVEGMGMADGIDILVADDPESFANKLIEVYTSESLWNKVSQGSLEFADRNYSYSMGVSRLRNLLASVGK